MYNIPLRAHSSFFPGAAAANVGRAELARGGGDT